MRTNANHSLYSHRDVFLRELVSNANDALEKLRITSLTDKHVLSGAENLNITIVAHKDEDGIAKLTIRDTGIGMTPEELTKNLVRMWLLVHLSQCLYHPVGNPREIRNF